jgi:hypothetical protein
MTTITRSKDRIKKTGEVFTPPWLVKEMLDALPQEVFTDSTKTFLDPAAGDGNFLVQVLQRKIDQGHNPLQALHTTYGVELMPDNVQECKRRLKSIALEALEEHQITDKILLAIDKILDNNIVCHDSLTWDYDAWQPLPLKSKSK